MSDKAFAIAMASIIPKGPKGDKGDTGDVSSVNSKTGAVVLDAGDLGYDSGDEYSSGTVGYALSDVKGDITNIENELDDKADKTQVEALSANDITYSARTYSNGTIGKALDDLKEHLNSKHTATAGYLLRATSTGNGSEWAAFGLPTDEQTADAISAWLDEHPEATTTVEDNSLTYKKLVNGTMNIVTPEMFGAVGDGVTDDSEALKACIASNTKVILKGTYLITETLAFNSIKNFVMTGGTITREEDATFNTINGSRCENILFSNIVFDGNGNNRETTYVWPNAVQACIKIPTHSTNIFVEKCTVKGHNYGIFIIGTDEEHEAVTYENLAYNGVIRDCVFYNCNAPIDTYGKMIVVDHCMFYQCTGEAVRLEANASASDANPIEDTNFYQSNTGSVVTNCLFMDNAHYDIDLYDNSHGCTISNNTFIDYAYGIYIGSNPKGDNGAEICNNTFIYQKRQTINANTRPYSYYAAINARRSLIHDNFLFSPFVGIINRGGCVIKNNVILDTPVCGITQYENSENTEINIIDGNYIEENVAEGLWWACYPIAIFTDYALNVITNDIAITDTARPLYVASGKKALVKNLISNHQSDSVTAPSGLYNYSNDS